MRERRSRVHETRAPRTDLKRVLALINVGRKALGLKPLGSIPKGMVGHPQHGPLSRAFQADVIGGECDRCGDRTALLKHRKAAAALATVYGVVAPRGRSASGDFDVDLPLELSVFEKEFDERKFPSLIDPDCLDLDDAADKIGISVDALRELIDRGVIAADPADSLDEVVVHMDRIDCRKLTGRRAA
jgi:hypothetical protein